MLFVSASAVLLAIAALAYPVFYYNYVPKKLITVPMHLQYECVAHCSESLSSSVLPFFGPNPHAVPGSTPTASSPCPQTSC